VRASAYKEPYVARTSISIYWSHYHHCWIKRNL